MTSEPTRRPQPAWGSVALCATAVAVVALLADEPRTPVAAVSGVAPAAATGRDPAAAPVPTPAPGMVHVTIPVGMLAITTPYTAATPLRLVANAVAFGSPTDIAEAVKILDTRPGRLGFTAQVQAVDLDHGGGAGAGLVGVQAVQVQGNGLRSADVRATDAPPDEPGLASPRTVATYAEGLGSGTAWLAGTLELTAGAAGHGESALTVTFTAF